MLEEKFFVKRKSLTFNFFVVILLPAVAKMGITIDDIAKECGVSKRTVSRVINNSPYVSPKTREKVKKVIQKYNYNANILAKNLAKGKGFDLIGLITGIEDLFGKYYFMEIIHNIEKYPHKTLGRFTCCL